MILKQSHIVGENTIVMFHIGKGGFFYNPGHKSFVGIKTITECNDFNNLLEMEDGNFVDECGNKIGLIITDVISGVGSIDIDGPYDTTYTCKVSDLSEEEISIIRESKDIEASFVIEFIDNN